VSKASSGPTEKELLSAAKAWKAAKKAERARRDALAKVVVSAVKQGTVSENRAATVTGVPRMTIRKMLGKD
jgi:predicted HTH domain antitoxin